MATKIKMLKLIQELENKSIVPALPQPQRPPGLYLIEIRSFLRRPAIAQKQIIRVNMLEETDLPRPVRIQHRATSQVS